MTDLQLDNFGKAGDKITDNLTRLRGDTQWLGDLPYRARQADYVMPYIGQNDAATVTDEDFWADMVHFLEHAMGLGQIPILVSPHCKDADMLLWGAGFELIYRNLAETYGAEFVDVTANARINDFGARYGDYWDGTHPGSRTNDIIAGPITEVVQRLPVRQSIKIFRKRTAVTVATVNDLLFNTYYDRKRLFDEILIGQSAIMLANEAKADVLTTWTSADSESIDSEYQDLQNNGTIALGEYSLLEIVLPSHTKHIDLAVLRLSETGATVYARGFLTTTVIDGQPDGNWVELAGAEGVYQLSNIQLRRFMREDKISILIYKAGGIAAFSEPSIELIGEPVPKAPKLRQPVQRRRALGANLAPNPDMGDDTSWTPTGTVVHGVPADGCLPRGSTGRVTVTNTDYVETDVPMTADATGSREVDVTFYARTNPAVGSITRDTFDDGLLQIEVGNLSGTVRAPYLVPVGTWWRKYTLRTIVPIDLPGLKVAGRGALGSNPIELAYAEVRLVDGP